VLARTGLRFGLEAVLIVAVAAVTGPILHLGALVIVGSVVAVWIVTALLEYSRAHPAAVGRPARRRRGESEHVEHEPSIPFEHVRVLPAAPPPRPVEPEPEPEPAVAREPETVVFEAPTEPEPEPEPEPVAAEAPTRIETVDEPAQPEPEAEPEPEPAAKPEPALAPVAGWPTRRAERDPVPVAVGASAQAATAPALLPEAEPLSVSTAPWSWNVWNLERVVRERAPANEELQFLLLYLRDYASPSGMLPPDFDGLVRESFGDLLAAPA
jgi:hypothetical protein